MNFVEILIWVVSAGLVLVVAMMLREAMTRNRASTYGKCEECGYDMRATPDLCPECGSSPPGRQASANINVSRLIETAPTDPIEPRKPGIEEVRCVAYETDHAYDAEILQEQLIARGISCVSEWRDSGMQRGAMVGRQTYVALVVWSGDEELAKAIISTAVRVNEPAGGAIET